MLFIGEEAEEPANFFMGQELEVVLQNTFFGIWAEVIQDLNGEGARLPDVGVVTTTERGLDQVVFLQQVMSHVNIPRFVIIPCP